MIDRRAVRRRKTGYRLYACEWNSLLSEVMLPESDGSRKRCLSEIGDKIRMDVRRFQKVIAGLAPS